MKVRIGKSTACGSVKIPSSKSYAHRLLICAGLSDGESRISGIDKNQDVLATADCLEALGASVRFDGRTAYVTGCGNNIRGGGRLVCRESGSTLRFLIPVSLLGGGGDFIGTERLISRGVGVYSDIFEKNGIEITPQTDKITVRGRLRAGNYTIPGDVSSQFITGMLFALPRADGDSRIEVISSFESRAYVDMTVDTLVQSGIDIAQKDGNIFEIHGNQRYRGLDTEAEGDWSNAACFFARNSIGGNVEVGGLKSDSRQGDRICLEYLDRLSKPDAVLDVSNCPDLAPILFTIAAARHGGVFTGTRRLAIKESNRAVVMAKELEKFGADIVVHDDLVEVRPSVLHAPSSLLCGHNDHRVVMSLSVLATVYGGVIDGAEAVSKSYPGFFEALRGLKVEVEDID